MGTGNEKTLHKSTPTPPRDIKHENKQTDNSLHRSTRHTEEIPLIRRQEIRPVFPLARVSKCHTAGSHTSPYALLCLTPLLPLWLILKHVSASPLLIQKPLSKSVLVF